MTKIIFIIIDGLGDSPIPELGNKTPLEAAKTANLDFLARQGVCGLINPFKFDWQEEPKSDTCHLASFGYEPEKYYLGRGVYEAFGIGVELQKGDIAMRANFATINPVRNFTSPVNFSKNFESKISNGINDGLKVVDRRAGRIEATQPLVDSLSGIEIEGVKFLLFKSYGHRAVLVMRGSNLSAEISDSDPKKEGENLKKVIAKRELPEAMFTADVLNKYLLQVFQILKNHPLNLERVKQGLLPANCILTRGAGCFKETISFKEKYGLRACCIAGGALYKGIGRILGMDLIEVEGATGFKNTNLKGKILAAKNAFHPVKSAKGGAAKPQFNRVKDYDFVFLHIKAADSLAEDGNFLGKKEFIEKIDENLKPLLCLKNSLIIVTGDHSTCCNFKKHCLEPFPVLIAGPGIKSDEVENFSESACQKGRLGQFEQLGLMPRILGLTKSCRK